MKYDYEEVFERIKYYRDKALNLADEELLDLLIADLVDLVMELEKDKDNAVFNKD